MKYADARSFLPLSPLAFQVLLSLASDSRHGYAVIAEIAERTGGLVRMRTGTMYLLLRRLVASGLIDETNARPRPEHDDERRRYYALTPLGRAVATAEARRLETMVRQARERHVLGRR
jgi:DNA-binding PadR family transcriptional regulator